MAGLRWKYVEKASTPRGLSGLSTKRAVGYATARFFGMAQLGYKIRMPCGVP